VKTSVCMAAHNGSRYIREQIASILSQILTLGQEKSDCLRMMLLGFLDGRAGRLGIRFSAKSSQANQQRFTMASCSAGAEPLTDISRGRRELRD
jgi:hypothetical protein